MKKAKPVKTPQQVENDRRSAAMNPQSKPRWETRSAQVVGRVPADAGGAALDGVVAQLQVCLVDVVDRLQRELLSPSDVWEMTVRTTSFSAARAQAGYLARWLRQHKAREYIYFVDVEELEPLGAAVEVVASAQHSTLVAGQLPSGSADDESDGPVPEHLRAAVRVELDALVRGERPDMLMWVKEYGEDGATLVVQPEEVWDHEMSGAERVPGGGWSVHVPVWTLTECPSELMAELNIDSSGTAAMYDLHVW